MDARGRSRISDEPLLGEAVPYPIAPMWVTGRFYGGSIHASLTTVTGSTTASLTPIIVPSPVTVTAIGVEVTTGGGTGSLARLAIYSDRNSVPDELIVDAGTVVADATGFQSVVISQVLKAGPYWLAWANKSVGGNPAYRAYNTTFSHSITIASVMAPSSTAVLCVTIANNPVTAGIVDTGWPRKFLINDPNVSSSAGFAAARVMLGV